MNGKKGFTLIEILTVVSIISFLSSVTLASINTARLKAADTAIKSNLANMRAQAEIYYTIYGTYGVTGNCAVLVDGTVQTIVPTCSSVSTVIGDPVFISGIKAATAISGATGYVNVGGAASSDTWAAYVPLKQIANSWWCVDSKGASKIEFSMVGNPASQQCP